MCGDHFKSTPDKHGKSRASKVFSSQFSLDDSSASLAHQEVCIWQVSTQYKYCFNFDNYLDTREYLIRLAAGAHSSLKLPFLFLATNLFCIFLGGEQFRELQLMLVPFS